MSGGIGLSGFIVVGSLGLHCVQGFEAIGVVCGLD